MGSRILASLIFFTRLPWWRLYQVPKEAFEHVVDYWPFIGWLTGGVMAATYLAVSALGFPLPVAALLAIAARLLLTGALHEDGLADFCDGFGGGTTRERTLSIMKDSHIGTYGVIGLILYFALLWSSLMSLPGTVSAACGAVMILLFDVAAKCAASLITGQLPYSRSEAGAKNQVVYLQRSMGDWFLHALRCAVALGLPVALCLVTGLSPTLFCVLPTALIVELLLVWWMRHRLGGYTGDCCGALVLLCELSLYLALLLVRI